VTEQGLRVPCNLIDIQRLIDCKTIADDRHKRVLTRMALF
jgi:hypothetical protein